MALARVVGLLQDAGRHALACVSTDGDTEVITTRKRVGLIAGLAGVVVSVLAWTSMPTDTVFKFVTVGSSLCASSALLFCIICFKSAPTAILETAAAGWGTAILTSSYAAAAIGIPGQSAMLVLVLDFLLITRCPQRSTAAGVALCIVMLLAVKSLATYDIRLAALPDHICDCAHPPCRVGRTIAVSQVMCEVIILLLDFYLTRGFASQVETEKAAVQASITTAEHVAVCLSGFDLDSAEALLTCEEACTTSLPICLREALQRILLNLRTYKPYLPKTCLPMDATAEPPPPEADVDDVSGSSPSVSSSLSSMTLRTPHSVSIRQELVPRSCTLMVTNMHNTLSVIDTDPDAFVTAFSRLLHHALLGVERARGMIDVFVGDRIFSSFNASRQCLQHASAAVEAAKAVCVCEQGVDHGIATGRIMCGDVGTSEMRRFNSVGRLMVVACGIERAARALERQALCSAVSQGDASVRHQLRRFPRLVSIRKGQRTGDGRGGTVLPNSPVFDVVIGTSSPASCEWMYALNDLANAWAKYNSAVVRFLQGESPGLLSKELLGSGSQAESEMFADMMETHASLDPLVICF